MNYIRFDADRFLFLFLFLSLILGLDFFLTNSITNLLVYEIVLVFSFRTIRVSSQRQPGHVEMFYSFQCERGEKEDAMTRRNGSNRGHT